MVEAVPKIEGHAAFYTHLKNGRVEEARIIGLENDRFVEKILLGRAFWEAPIITSRICGICPTIHNVTSTRAIENACGIKPTQQTVMLRKLMLAGQMIQSHSLHLYLLVLPDYVGVGSSFELQKDHPELFKNAIVLKKYADKILEIVGGRAVHPIASVPGGFKSYPAKKQLEELRKLAEPALAVAQETLQLFASFKYPEIKQTDLIYSALHQADGYAYYDGDIWTSDGTTFEAVNYTDYIFEELKPYTRAKFGTLKGKTMYVGAMARLNLNRPAEMTRELEKVAGLKFPLDNPFQNILAQAAEVKHFILETIESIEKLLKTELEKEHLRPPRQFGAGSSACEAPRGTLFHHYELDKEGRIAKCDIVTPTVQNLGALEEDIKTLVKLMKSSPKEERDQAIEALIRAYDPCITCATH